MTNPVDLGTFRRRPDDQPPSTSVPTRADVERAERAAASARCDAFVAAGPPPRAPVASDAGRPDCSHPEDFEHFDYDGCDKEEVACPVPFLRQPGTVDEVSASDVVQTKMGDCYLMATLAALADTPAGRALIKGAITVGAGDGGEPTYTVTLHVPRAAFFGPTSFTEVKVTVDARYALGHANPPQDNQCPQEVWPLVIEKAYASLNGGYNAVARSGSAATAMQIITGKEAQQIKLDWLTSYSAETLESDRAAGKIVVFQTRRDIDPDPSKPPVEQVAAHIAAHRLFGGHAYSVSGTEERNGRLYLKLHNPWSAEQPDPVPYDELHAWFSAVDVGSVR